MSISDKRLEELLSVKDEDIDFSDIPELGDEYWKRAKLVKPEYWGSEEEALDDEIYKLSKEDGKKYPKIKAFFLSSIERYQGVFPNIKEMSERSEKGQHP